MRRGARPARSGERTTASVAIFLPAPRLFSTMKINIREHDTHFWRAVQNDGRRRFGSGAVSRLGASANLTDRSGGQMDVMFDGVAVSLPYIRAGRLRPLAVTTVARLEVLPNVPTLGKFVPGYEAGFWQGIGAPKDTSAEHRQAQNKTINAASPIPR